MKPSHRRVVELMKAGCHLDRPALGERAYRLTDPHQPEWTGLVHEATVDEMFDLDPITRAHVSAPIHLVVP